MEIYKEIYVGTIGYEDKVTLTASSDKEDNLDEIYREIDEALQHIFGDEDKESIEILTDEKRIPLIDISRSEAREIIYRILWY